MTVTKYDRQRQIIKFVRDHPFCSMDSIFTKGKIPKSSATIDILYDLVSKKKIQITQTKSGNDRYFINDVNWDVKTKWSAIKFVVQNFKKILNQTKECTPTLSLVCDSLSKLLDLRLKIIEFEYRHAKKLGKNFNGNGLRQILNKYQRFQSKFPSEPTIQKIRDFENWINSEISRDMYYLDHHINSIAVRSLTDKIEISRDRHLYGLTRQTQIYHEKSLKSKNKQPENEYDEIFNRLNAERDRVLVSNPNTTPNEIIKSVCLKRLDMIKSKRSKRYNSERQILKDTIRQLEQNPILLYELLKEKEEED